MTNRIYLALILIFATGIGDAVACSCMSKGHFVEYTKHSKGVIRATVLSYGDKLPHGGSLYESMTVEVVSVISGEVNFESIVLLGDPGHLCREYVDSRNFEIGAELLIALRGETRQQPFGGCGEAWLKIDADVAVGRAWRNGELREYARPLQELMDEVRTIWQSTP